MSVPPHIQQTFDDLAALRGHIDTVERTLRHLYDAPSIAVTTPPAPVVEVEARPRKARAATASPPTETTAVVPATGKRRGTEGSKYDEGMLRALKGELAQHGLTSSDLCRVFTGPGKPQEVARISGGVTIALQQRYQGAPVRIHLTDRKGGDIAEWPEALRVRQFPAEVRA